VLPATDVVHDITPSRHILSRHTTLHHTQDADVNGDGTIDYEEFLVSDEFSTLGHHARTHTRVGGNSQPLSESVMLVMQV
jgi:hypothetical protein